MVAHLIYSPNYDFSLFGFEKLHRFDAKKYSRAWSIIQRQLGEKLSRYWIEPKIPVADEVLLQIHTKAYLESLRSSATVAKALELPLLKVLPNVLLQSKLLRAMRYAVEGTIIATEFALRDGIAMNCGGGFHHAFADHGEGFSIFADAAISIAAHRAAGRLAKDDRIIMIDLDAHRGNGFETIFRSDPLVHIFDIYNFQTYPGLHPGDEDQFPFIIPVRAHVNDDHYLKIVREDLPSFLDESAPARLAFYNAGTDIVSGDPLGGLDISAEGVAQRDKAVIEMLSQRGIPTVVVTSGGYTAESHALIAQLALHIVARFG